MRPAKILLVGYDLRIDLGLHWHGPHNGGLNNPWAPNVERWRRCLDETHEVVRSLGIRTINCSPVSALQNFPKMDLLEAIEC